jgi:hypothetical protein
MCTKEKFSMNLKQTSGIILLIFLFVGGVGGGYLYFSKVIPQEKAASEVTANSTKTEDLLSLKIYYPVGDQLQMEERRPPRRMGSTAIAEATLL